MAAGKSLLQLNCGYQGKKNSVHQKWEQTVRDGGEDGITSCKDLRHIITTMNCKHILFFKVLCTYQVPPKTTHSKDTYVLCTTRYQTY